MSSPETVDMPCPYCGDTVEVTWPFTPRKCDRCSDLGRIENPVTHKSRTGQYVPRGPKARIRYRR